VRELAGAGHQVLIYDNFSTGHRALSDGFNVIEGDIADAAKLERHLAGIDAVIHLAASGYVHESIHNPRKYFRNNVQAALALIDVVLSSGIQLFVFSSSCAVYGIPPESPIQENFPKEPINPYGATKLFIEHALSACSAAHGLRYVALRYFNAAGAYRDGTIGERHDPETHLVPLALRAALGQGPPLRVFGTDLSTPDGTCIRDFTHVSDIGAAHVLALDYLVNGGPSVSLNLGTGKGHSVAEVLAAVKQVTSRDVPVVPDLARVGDPPILIADPSKARRILGWEAARSMDEVIRTAWLWETRSRLSR
jgi:UDP-glucose-4-epimerase GalE